MFSGIAGQTEEYIGYGLNRTLNPGIANTQINNSGLIAGKAEILGIGTVTIPSVTANAYGSITATVPSGATASRIIVMVQGGVTGTAQLVSLSGTTLTIGYRYTSDATDRPIRWIAFKT